MNRFALALILFGVSIHPAFAQEEVADPCPDVAGLQAGPAETNPEILKAEMDNGSVSAALTLARQAERRKDYAEAEKLYRFALYNKDGRGALGLYALHESGAIEVKDAENIKDYGFSLIENNALNGDGTAALNLAAMYLKGDGVEVDHDKAKEWLETADAAGKPLAAYELGMLHTNGLSFPILPRVALRYFKKAAARGVSEATRQVAIAYEIGIGTVKDERQAMTCFERAAKQGGMLAMRDMGNIQKKRGNYGSSIEWYKKAAELGDPDSHYQLGMIYKRSKAALSKEHLEKAVKLKHHMARIEADPGYLPGDTVKH